MFTTFDWAVQLSPQVEPNAFVFEYHAENLSQIGCFPSPIYFGGIAQLADLPAIWLEEQIPHQ